MNDGMLRTNPWNPIWNIWVLWIAIFSSWKNQSGVLSSIKKSMELELTAHFHQKKKNKSHEVVVRVQETKHALKYLLCLVASS